MNKKNILIFVLLLLFVFFKSLLIFVIPGILIIFFIKKNLSEMIVYVVACSISFWIITFWFLNYIPLSLTTFFRLIFLITAIAIIQLKSIKKIKYDKMIIGLIIIVSIIRFIPFFQGYFPAGADMSFHTLTTEMIVQSNSVPKNYLPIFDIKYGAYPTGFHALSAYFSLLTTTPTYRSVLFLSNFSYAFLLLAFYIFLRNFFNQKISLLSAFIITFIPFNPQYFIAWGGSPFVLSFSLMIISASLIWKFNKLNKIQVILFSMFSAASILIHPMSIYGFFLAYLPLFVYKNRNIIDKKFIKKSLFIVLLFIIFILPYALNYKFDISQREQDWTKERNENKFLSWNGNINNIFRTIPRFLRNLFGPTFLILSFFSMVFLSIKKDYINEIITLIITVFVLIINSKYWIIPFSYLLFSERIALILLIPFSISIGLMVKELFSIKLFKDYKTIMLLLVITFLFLIAKPQINHYNNSSDNFAMVTSEDLVAMDWINKNTPKDAVFLNNYGDAGLWISPLTQRFTIKNQIVPVYFDETDEIISKLKPNYVYIGKKNTYETNLELNDFKDNSKYDKIYSKNEVHIFKIK
jgi:hypothetical protein